MGELGAGSGSGYPAALDTNATLEVDSPAAGKTKVRADVPNDLAAAIVAVETELGINPAGSVTDLVTRLAVVLEDDGNLKALGNTALHILDTDASHDLIVKPGSNITADRTLTITTGDSDRTVTLNGNPTLNDWFDQAVKTTSLGTLTGLTINSATVTLSQDTNFVLSGGVNGISFDTNVLSIDATNDRVGIRTTTPSSALTVAGGRIHAQGDTPPTVGAGVEVGYNSVTGVGQIVTFDRDATAYKDFRINSLSCQFDISGVAKVMVASSGNVGIGTITPAASALLDLTSTTGALLLTRMTTTQKNALTAVDGMILYDSTLNKVQVREGGAWASVV